MNLGYWVRTDATRRGIATAATRRLARWAFEALGLRRVEIVIAPGNAAGGLSLPWTYPLAHPGGEVVDLDQDGLSDILRGKVRLRGLGGWFDPCSFAPGAWSTIDLDGAPPLELLARDGAAVLALVAQ